MKDRVLNNGPKNPEEWAKRVFEGVYDVSNTMIKNPGKESKAAVPDNKNNNQQSQQ